MALIILHPTIAGAHQIILTPSTPGGGEPTNDPEYSTRDICRAPAIVGCSIINAIM